MNFISFSIRKPCTRLLAFPRAAVMVGCGDRARIGVCWAELGYRDSE